MSGLGHLRSRPGYVFLFTLSLLAGCGDDFSGGSGQPEDAVSDAGGDESLPSDSNNDSEQTDDPCLGRECGTWEGVDCGTCTVYVEDLVALNDALARQRDEDYGVSIRRRDEGRTQDQGAADR